jgi:hypothetical protein
MGGKKHKAIPNIGLKKWLTKQENTNEQIVEKFTESFKNLQSYCLCIYRFCLFFFIFFTIRKNGTIMMIASLPALFFIFTFLLVLILFFIDKIFPLFGNNPILEWVHFSLKSLGIFWMIYYFFPAHRRFMEKSYGLLSQK